MVRFDKMSLFGSGRSVEALERRIESLERENAYLRKCAVEDAQELFQSIAQELQDLRNSVTKQPEVEQPRKAVRVTWRQFAAMKTKQAREQLEGATQ
jgi:predicted RNA-binding protein with EMAP domain